MLILCPACSASYRVSADTLGPRGRVVRCASCRATWRATSNEALAEPVEKPQKAQAEILGRAGQDFPVGSSRSASASARISQRGQQPASGRSSGAANLGGPVRLKPAPVVAAAGVLALAAALLWRESVVSAVPETARLYAAMGLPVNLRGLALREVKTVEVIEKGSPILIVSGNIDNVSRAPVELPRLRLALRNTVGREVYVWSVPPGAARLAPGESVPFRAQLGAPPPDAREVSVRFLNRRDAPADLAQRRSE